jgi:hypothetical protein
MIVRGTFEPSPNADKCESDLGVATPEAIRKFAIAFAPEEMKEVVNLDHEGIAVDICEKASVIYYFSDGAWRTYQGAD